MPRIIYPGLVQTFPPVAAAPDAVPWGYQEGGPTRPILRRQAGRAVSVEPIPPGPAATAAVSWGYQEGSPVRPPEGRKPGRVPIPDVFIPGPAATNTVSWGYQEGSPLRPPAGRKPGWAPLPETWPPISTVPPGAVFWGWQTDQPTRPRRSVLPVPANGYGPATPPFAPAFTIWGWSAEPVRPRLAPVRGRVVPFDALGPAAVTVWGWAGEVVRPKSLSPRTRPIQPPFFATPPSVAVPGTWGWHWARPVTPVRLRVGAERTPASWTPFEPVYVAPPDISSAGRYVCATLTLMPRVTATAEFVLSIDGEVSLVPRVDASAGLGEC